MSESNKKSDPLVNNMFAGVTKQAAAQDEPAKPSAAPAKHQSKAPKKEVDSAKGQVPLARIASKQRKFAKGI